MTPANTELNQSPSDGIDFLIQFRKRQMSPRNPPCRIAGFRKHDSALMWHDFRGATKTVGDIQWARRHGRIMPDARANANLTSLPEEPDATVAEPCQTRQAVRSLRNYSKRIR